MHEQGAMVVAQVLPGLDNFVGLSDCKGRYGGKFLEKAMVIGDYGSYLRLLKHDLRDPDGVRVTGPAPGKLPAMTTIPAEDSPDKNRFLEGEFFGVGVRRGNVRAHFFFQRSSLLRTSFSKPLSVGR